MEKTINKEDKYPLIMHSDYASKGYLSNLNPHWNNWKWQLKNRIMTLDQIKGLMTITPEEEAGILWSKGKLAMAITPYFFSLIDPEDLNCPIRKQVIPRIEESVIVSSDLNDPCGEDKHSPLPGLVHRYPDRVLLILTETCATYCRYCTRKRVVSSGDRGVTSSERHILKNLERAIDYIHSDKRIRDVLISGGDPLILETEKLDVILSRLRKIGHVEIIRIGTKIPVTMPQRIDKTLTEMLRKYHPLFMSIHFTHPKELSPECRDALSLLADAGIPLGSQTVLLKGINDRPEVMKELMHGLLKSRVRPYYLYQADPVSGTSHFRTPISKGIEIIEKLQGYTTGYAIPTYVIDAPGGGGKVPITPDYVLRKEKGKIILRNYEGKVFEYLEIET